MGKKLLKRHRSELEDDGRMILKYQYEGLNGVFLRV